MENLAVSREEKPAKTTEEIALERAEREKKLNAKYEEALKQLDRQIEELIRIYTDPKLDFSTKMRTLVAMPNRIQFQHGLLNRERANKLFGSIPEELFVKVFEQSHVEFARDRAGLIHILGYIVQITTPDIHRKFKPCMPNLVSIVSPRNKKPYITTVVYNDVTTIVCSWTDEKGDGKCVYQLLRCLVAHYASQKNNLEIGQFLLGVRMLIQKIYFLAPLETPADFDNKVWPIGILSIVRNLMQERVEKFNKDLRQLMWDVISSMTRVGGTAWFNLDKTFAKLCISMNFVELQMTISDAHNPDVTGFLRHLRVLELYTNAICDSEMFGEEGMEIIPQTVGHSTRFILKFWVDCHMERIPLPAVLIYSIFNYAIFVVLHEDMAVVDENTRKNFGVVALETAFICLENASLDELKAETGQLYRDFLDKLNDFETLDERVPIFIMKYLDKLRLVDNYEAWKERVIDCRCCMKDLCGRIDWYSKQSIAVAREFLPRFTPPEQHELSHLFKLLDERPQIN